VAQPDRDCIWDYPPEAPARRKLHIGSGFGIAVAAIHELLQHHDGPPLRLDLHRQARAEATPGEVRRSAPPSQIGQSPKTSQNERPMDSCLHDAALASLYPLFRWGGWTGKPHL